MCIVADCDPEERQVPQSAPDEALAAMAAACPRSGASVSEAQAANCTPARAISTCWNISTSRCRTVW